MCASSSKKSTRFDQKVDAKYANWQKALQKGRKEKLQRELKKMSAKLQEMFPKFYYKQKVVEEMIVVAGNVHEKFQASLRHIQELEAQRTTAERRAALEAERAKIQTLEQFVRMPREEFYKVFKELKAAADRGLRPRRTWPRPICASSCPSPKNTPTAASRSSI